MTGPHHSHDLHALRGEAKTLLRAVSTHDPGARERAAAVLGSRVGRRFVLADALHVVAREQGAESWPALVAHVGRGPIRAALQEEADADGVAEIDVETPLSYPDGAPVTITVRRRGRRLVLDDRGAAVARRGRPRGWANVAERAAGRSHMNVSRTTGVVFVPAFDNGRRDLEALARRLARASLDVLEALVELEDDAPRAARRRAG